MPVSNGINSLRSTVPPYNADLVNKLLSAGAIILAKATCIRPLCLASHSCSQNGLVDQANMAEMGLIGMGSMSSLGGETKNAYNPFYTPFGSRSEPSVSGPLMHSFCVQRRLRGGRVREHGSDWHGHRHQRFHHAALLHRLARRESLLVPLCFSLASVLIGVLMCPGGDRACARRLA